MSQIEGGSLRSMRSCSRIQDATRSARRPNSWRAEDAHLGTRNFPLEHESVLFAHLFDNALAHSAVTFRRAAIQSAGGYDEAWTASQDYELWSRVSANGELRNLRERLVTLRVL
jgi:hypothetical protein